MVNALINPKPTAAGLFRKLLRGLLWSGRWVEETAGKLVAGTDVASPLCLVKQEVHEP